MTNTLFTVVPSLLELICFELGEYTGGILTWIALGVFERGFDLFLPQRHKGTNLVFVSLWLRQL